MRGIVFLCVAAFLWGTVGVANGLMADRDAIDPAMAGLARTALGATSLLVAAQVLGVRWTAWRHLPHRLLAAFGLAGAVFQVYLFAAFAGVGVTVSVAVTVCLPVILIVVADALWRRRAPDAGVTLAVCVAVAGV